MADPFAPDQGLDNQNAEGQGLGAGAVDDGLTGPGVGGGAIGPDQAPDQQGAEGQGAGDENAPAPVGPPATLNAADVALIVAGMQAAGLVASSIIIMPGPFALTAAAADLPLAAGVGDTFAVAFYLTVNNGRTRLPLAGKTVTITTRNQNGGLLSDGVACDITNAATGEISYMLQDTDTADDGYLRLTATVTDTATGKGQTYGPVTMPVQLR